MKILLLCLLTITTLFSCDSDPTLNYESPNLHVYVMYPFFGLGDRSYADIVYEGIVRARLETKFSKTQAAPSELEESEEIFSSWTATPAKGRELIILVGYSYAELIVQAKCSFGGRYVVFIDYFPAICHGLKSFTYRPFAPSFLAGVAAVKVSPKHQAAVIGGADVPVVNEFIRGFKAGVEYAGGKLTALEYLSDSEEGFAMPDKARDLAEKLYNDADVIFPVAGGSGLGVFEAAWKEDERYIIGVDVDQSWMGRGIVIGSVVKKLDVTVMQAVKDVAADVFVDGHFALGMEDEGTDFVINEVFAKQVEGVVDAARQEALNAAATDQKENP